MAKIVKDRTQGYGELSFKGVLDIIEDIKEHQPVHNFLDIGSGYGFIPRAVRDILNTEVCVGIEINKERFDICNMLHKEFDKTGYYKGALHYVKGDIYKQTHFIKKADYIFSNSCLFHKDFPQFVVDNMKKGAVFITNSKYKHVDTTLNLDVTWQSKQRPFSKIIKK